MPLTSFWDKIFAFSQSAVFDVFEKPIFLIKNSFSLRKMASNCQKTEFWWNFWTCPAYLDPMQSRIWQKWKIQTIMVINYWHFWAKLAIFRTFWQFQVSIFQKLKPETDFFQLCQLDWLLGYSKPQEWFHSHLRPKILRS